MMTRFRQYLEEDPRTNRIDDSLQLFTAICSNQLLKNIHLVLFLSKSRLLLDTGTPYLQCVDKTDVLQAKLANGVRVSK
jgi:guanine nucleotide-binding protein subunit alpha